MTKPTLETIDTKLDMYMSSTDKAIAAMSEAITVVSKSQAESKAMQVEINSVTDTQKENSQEVKSLQKEVAELTRRVDANSHTSNDLKEVRKEHRAMGNKLLGSVIFVCICAVAGLFFR